MKYRSFKMIYKEKPLDQLYRIYKLYV